jgi:hypothetical protein
MIFHQIIDQSIDQYDLVNFTISDADVSKSLGGFKRFIKEVRLGEPNIRTSGLVILFI